jgi:hypothetical protein
LFGQSITDPNKLRRQIQERHASKRWCDNGLDGPVGVLLEGAWDSSDENPGVDARS